MEKYKVIYSTDCDKAIGLKFGDIVEATKYKVDDSLILIRLPKRLHGKGHNGNGKGHYKKKNYRFINTRHLEVIE